MSITLPSAQISCGLRGWQRREEGCSERHFAIYPPRTSEGDKHTTAIRSSVNPNHYEAEVWLARCITSPAPAKFVIEKICRSARSGDRRGSSSHGIKYLL